MDNLITSALNIVAAIVVLWILGGLAWALFRQGGETNSPQSSTPPDERYVTGKAEFDRIRAKEQARKEREFDEHDIWERKQEYLALARTEIEKARTWNKLTEGFSCGRNEMERGPGRLPIPDRKLTEREWQIIDYRAQEAAERDHRQQGRRPRDARGYKIR